VVDLVDKTSSLLLSPIRLANKATRQRRLLRKMGILGYTSIVRANVFLPPPRVLLNGPGKSGTHLLSDCLSLMPKMMFSGRHFALPEFFRGSVGPPDPRARQPASSPPLDVKRLRKYLERCPRGMFVTAHARFHPDFSDLVEDLGFKHILLLRDPRDIAVSHASYMLRDTLHVLHGYYTEMLKSDDERLMASIRGFEGDAGPYLPPIRESFGAYLPWTEDPSTLVVRFEQLIGPRGGGDADKQLAEIERIARFVERPLSRQQASRIALKTYAQESLTFRKGQVGDWRNRFTEAHKRAFKDTAGDLLIELGYEGSSDW
jgi:sulfotransferase 6B1